MSTRSLLVWAALVAGAELAVRGYLGGDGLACHGGAALFAAGLGGLAARARRGAPRRLGLGAAALLLALAAFDAALSRAPDEAPAAGAPPPPAGAAAGVPSSAPEPEAPAEDAFRVAVLGGSTALGATPGADPAWPERLEAEIRERFACERRVVVGNAARAGEPLGGGAAAVERLADTLRPDLLLVQAGPSLLEALLEEAPSLRFPAPPRPPERASRLVASLERRLRAAARERRWRAALAGGSAPDPRRSAVAERYRDLVVAARRRGIDVVLLITSLAVAPDAPPAALRALERTRPRTRAWILANRYHARLVRGIAGSYGLGVVDTRPGLDGSGSAGFRDLAQPTAAGHARIADAVADGLAPRLAAPPTRCRRPSGARREDPVRPIGARLGAGSHLHAPGTGALPRRRLSAAAAQSSSAGASAGSGGKRSRMLDT